ncbi:HMA2 domain-containing protein [Ferrimonas lipolytica]|uniref:Cation transporter n=1 Tax=Ferrimonas lipolytica TaxID=2724191 RepID=A0A6H1UAX4_9GAMM|nr:cation transporter [Ferrimonas lipolytica]QIZ76227.1 cation transporter [Ferrimonas lipolytica]
MPELTNEILSLRQWVHIGHHIPGRIRLKFNSAIVAKLARYKTTQTMEHAIQFAPLKRYQLNSETNSLLLEYDAAVIEPQLLDRLFHDDDQQARAACTSLINTLTPIYQAGA